MHFAENDVALRPADRNRFNQRGLDLDGRGARQEHPWLVELGQGQENVLQL
jgi:hypothetical protein